MCGRFVIDNFLSDIAKEYDIESTLPDVPPSYNVAPGQKIAIILNDGQKKLLLCKWGFLPSWAKDPSVANKMINARAESVAEKPSFRSAFKKHRILIPASGFYEWKKVGKQKIPCYVFLKSKKLFGFAGLYNVWLSEEGNEICTCTIITTNANSLLESIHNRMPVIIQKKDEDMWLDPRNEGKDLLGLLRPYASEEMDYYGVSTLVNKPANNSPECIHPVKKRPVS